MSELAEPFDASLPAVSKHLSVLERAGLLEHHKLGVIRALRPHGAGRDLGEKPAI